MLQRVSRALRLAASVSTLGACMIALAHADPTSAPGEPAASTAPANTANTSAPTQVAANTQTATSDGSAVATIPPFIWGATVNASEGYVSNASGLSGGSKSDFVTTFGLSAFIHDHAGRVTLDATNNVFADIYDEGTRSAQFSEHLQALGSVVAIPDHLTIYARAFASPVLTSDLGIATAGNRVVPGGFRNSVGYFAQPDLRFRFGTFMTSDTTANYGSTYFFDTGGNSAVPVIPGLAGPQDTTVRSATQTFTSGEDFVRLNWTLAGAFSELERRQGLLSEKAGLGNFRYAVSHSFSLLATIGYDAVTDTVPLTRNISGMVALGGFALTFGQDFFLQIQAGRKYNDASYLGSLRYNINPTASIVGALNDAVTTPEGQLLNNLLKLTANANGDLTSPDNLYGNGSVASLSDFNPQSPGSLSFDQNISRYQTASLSFLEDFERNHADFTVFGTRRTILSGTFIGPPRTSAWGARLSLAHDFTPLMQGMVGTSYTVNDELGGEARTLNLNAQLGYTMTREMRAYIRGDYLDRQSSASLNALSPITGSLTDYRITIGFSRTL